MKRSRTAKSPSLVRQRALIRTLIEQTGLAGEPARPREDDAPLAPVEATPGDKILRFVPAPEVDAAPSALAPILPFPGRPAVSGNASTPHSP